MEVKKFQERLRDWAISLGFRLPDGSVANADYFVSLTITPRRRQLWETVIESVLPRQKVEYMRKQILVVKLKNEKNYSNSDSKHSEDKVELWQKQNKLETEIKEKHLEVKRLELSIMTVADDTLFQFDILAELEKQYDDIQEKILFLKLFQKRQEKIVNDLAEKLKEGAMSCEANVEKSGKESLEFTQEGFLSTEVCKHLLDGKLIDLLNKIEKLCYSQMAEHQVWEEVIKCKKNLIEKFSAVLEEMNSHKKIVMSEKKPEIERKKTRSIIKLKQKITEKSLEVALNATEVKLLDLEVGKLVERVLARQEEGVLDETVSFLSCNEMNESFEERQNLVNYLNLLGLKSYREFLKEELKILEDDATKNGRKESKDEAVEAFQTAVKDFKSAVGEIISSKTKGKEAEENILKQYDKLQMFLRLLKEEAKDNDRTQSVEEVVLKLCSAPEKQIERFLDTPLDAFRTFETSSGRMMFECESASYRLKNYGGDLKLFCPAMLIPPLCDVQNILAEIKRRNVISINLKKFISERDRLAALEKKVNDQLNGINYEHRVCEKNYVQSRGILQSISFRTEKIVKEKEFIEIILKFWLEQPFRSMIRGKDSVKNEKQSK